VLYSILRTCAQHDVPPLAYLTDVLRKLANGWPKNRLEELLPDRWHIFHSGGNTDPLTEAVLSTAAIVS
jgi:hypothetical protein